MTAVTELEPLRWRCGSVVRECPAVHFQTGALVTCKRRDCPRCGPGWAMSWWTVSAANLGSYGGPVAMITITGPGASDVLCPCGCGATIPGLLPWACTRDHKHEGAKGCRVDDAALWDWCETLSDRMKRLREAARIAALRELARRRACPVCGAEPGTGCIGPRGSRVGWLHRLRRRPGARLLERAWEPQKRGAPHVHLVVGMATEEAREAAQVFADELHRLAPTYGFGRVHGGGPNDRLRVMTAGRAASYLASYLTGRSRKKGSIRENIADPRLPRSLVWVSPSLTEKTLCTMRRLRQLRWYMACLKGRFHVLPQWRGDSLIEIARLAAFMERARFGRGDPADVPAEAPSPPDERVRFHCSMLITMRQLAASA